MLLRPAGLARRTSVSQKLEHLTSRQWWAGEPTTPNGGSIVVTTELKGLKLARLLGRVRERGAPSSGRRRDSSVPLWQRQLYQRPLNTLSKINGELTGDRVQL